MTQRAIEVASTRSPLARGSLSVLEFFLLRRRLRDARAEDFDPADPAPAERKLGFAILRDAHQLGNSASGRDTALLAYRAAVRLLLPAEVRRGQARPNLDTWADIWREARASGLVRNEHAKLERALASERGEAELASASSSERESLLRELRALANHLAERSYLGALKVERLLWLRRFRIAGLGLVLALATGFALRGKPGPKNLALHQPVTLSDDQPFLAVDPRHLVDDDELNLGFHTANRENAYVTIDLGSVVPITRVDVFNRPDCCQERAVPLSVQVSSDGQSFTTVERRVRSFHDWHVSLPANSRARYVRLQHEGYELFHLAEVRVF